MYFLGNDFKNKLEKLKQNQKLAELFKSLEKIE